MEKISTRQSKVIKRLALKKFRKTDGLFVVEGKKMLEELFLSNFKVQHVFTTPEYFEVFAENLRSISHSIHSDKEIARCSLLKTSPGVLALVEIPTAKKKNSFENWTLVLNDINDPGNLGSIIRTADWFGFQSIICTENTVDCYSPKVVQATMGSIFRLAPTYANNADIVAEIEASKIPVFKAEMLGENALQYPFPKQGVLIMGSESHGVSADFSQIGTYVSIPRFGKSESLNVVVATGIIASHIFK